MGLSVMTGLPLDEDGIQTLSFSLLEDEFSVSLVGSTSSASNMYEVGNENSNPYRNIVMDSMRMSEGNVSECPIIEEESNADATRFFDMLKDSDEPQ
jgi:hypothetical protein